MDIERKKTILAGRMKEPSNRAIIYILRHGSTKLNSEDKIRGWLDLPLDEQGKEEARKMGQNIKKEGLDGLLVSDLQRTKQTAEIVSKEANIPILSVTAAFRPWNVGVHQGKLAEEVLPEMENYARRKPNTPIPEGESFNQFKTRFLDGIEQAQRLKGKKIGIVTHHRGDRIMAAWEKKGMPRDKSLDLNTMFQKGINPGTWRRQGTKINTATTPD